MKLGISVSIARTAYAKTDIKLKICKQIIKGLKKIYR